MGSLHSVSGRVDIEIASRYRLESLVARGGMAEVWEGYDRLLDRAVAVKMPLGHLREQPEFLARFQREAVAAARLSHPLVVAVYDTGIDPEAGAYIVMELVRGGSLRDVLKAEGSLPVARAVAIASQVATALQFAHERGVVHRDVKPANILLADDPTEGPPFGSGVKVADFGIAKAAVEADDLTKTNVTLGTARYLSPEQVEGGPTDARSDVYSLGVVLYEMLCGRAPFLAESDVATALKHLTATPEPPSSVNPDVPGWLDTVVLTALAKRPEARFESAAAFRRAIDKGVPVSSYADAPTPPEGIELTSAIPVVTRPPVEPVGSGGSGPGVRTGRTPLLVGAGLVGAAGLAALLFGVLGRGTPGSGPAAGAAAATGAPVAVTSAHAFDPPPGDGVEDNPDLPKLVDGNPATTWRTEFYTNAQFGNLKSGVGAYLELRNPASVSRLVIQSPAGGWRYQVYEVDGGSAPGVLSGWGSPVAGGTAGAGVTNVSLPGHPATFVLLWITDLGGSYASGLPVGELSLFS